MLLGRGSFGRVYLVDGFAVKVFDKPSDIFHENAIIDTLSKRYPSEFVVPACLASYRGRNVIKMPVCVPISQTRRPADPRLLLPSLLDACRFLLSFNNLLHTDIKPANLLVDREGRVVLCDLGGMVAARTPVIFLSTIHTAAMRNRLRTDEDGVMVAPTLQCAEAAVVSSCYLTTMLCQESRAKSACLQRALAFWQTNAAVETVTHALADSHPWGRRALTRGVSIEEGRTLARRPQARAEMGQLVWRNGPWREA